MSMVQGFFQIPYKGLCDLRRATAVPVCLALAYGGTSKLPPYLLLDFTKKSLLRSRPAPPKLGSVQLKVGGVERLAKVHKGR